jgi:transcriptional regulator
MESERNSGWKLAGVQEYADRIAPYTTGFRLVPDRIVGKSKMSQDKPAEIVERVITAVQSDPVHGGAALAAEMRRRRDRASAD